MTTPAQQTELPESPAPRTFEATFFRPPKRPNGGTVFRRPPTDTGETR